MDQALFLRVGNAQILPQPLFTRSKIISAGKLTNSHDLLFFRSKYNTPSTISTTPLISSLSNCFSTTLTVGHPQRTYARRLISTTIFAHNDKQSKQQNGNSDPNGLPSKGKDFIRGFVHGIVYLNCPKSKTILVNPPTYYSEHVVGYKKTALEKMKDGKPEEALTFLKQILETSSGPAEKLYIEMALAEIRIYQGRFEEALEMDCLEDENVFSTFDVGPAFYKAIIYTMKRDGTAKKYWQYFFDNGFMNGVTF